LALKRPCETVDLDALLTSLPGWAASTPFLVWPGLELSACATAEWPRSRGAMSCRAAEERSRCIPLGREVELHRDRKGHFAAKQPPMPLTLRPVWEAARVAELKLEPPVPTLEFDGESAPLQSMIVKSAGSAPSPSMTLHAESGLL
jgi:hypothetical protein